MSYSLGMTTDAAIDRTRWAVCVHRYYTASGFDEIQATFTLKYRAEQWLKMIEPSAKARRSFFIAAIEE